MDIIRSKDFVRPVKPNEIHGSFPYKLYLEVYGTNLFGRYIVIAGDEEIELDDNDEVRIKFNDTDDKIAKGCDFLAHRVDYLTVKRADVAIWVFIKDTRLPEKPKKIKVKRPKTKKKEDKKMEQTIEKDIMEYDDNDIKEAEAPTQKKLEKIKKLDGMSKYFTTVYLWMYYLVMGMIAFSLIFLVSKFPDKMWADYVATCFIAVGLLAGSYFGCKSYRIKHDRVKVRKLPWWKKMIIIVSSVIMCLLVVMYLGLADAFNDGKKLMDQFEQSQQEYKEDQKKQEEAAPHYDNMDDVDAAIAAGELIIPDTPTEAKEIDTQEMANTVN